MLSDLKKCVDQKLRKQVLDILAKLHSHTPSPRVLNTTKIHIYIQSKLAGMDGDIGRDAKGLISKWKKTLPAAPSTTASSPMSRGSSTPTAGGTPRADSPSHPPLPDIPSCGSSDRDRLRLSLRDDIAKVYFAVSDSQRATMRSPNAAAAAIEDSLFFHFKDTDTAYKQQLLSIKNAISCNASDPEARDWVEAVLCIGGDAFEDASFPTLTPEAMMNRAMRKKRDKDREKELFEASFGEVMASTDMFSCARCGKRDCRYHQKQTRASDEPMTVFITCNNCGKTWRK